MSAQRTTAEPSEQEIRDYLTRFSNWGRWGADDRLGTLNLITPEKVRTAAALVRDGRLVSCSRIVEWAPRPPSHEAAVPPIHFMQRSGETAGQHDAYEIYDWMGVPLHGMYITHMDAQSHMAWQGKLYNGMDAAQVRGDRGATVGGIDDVSARGVMTRGVLLDVPRARGVDWLIGAEGVTRADLEAAERLAGVEVEPGDMVLVRTGYGAHRRAEHDQPLTPSGAEHVAGLPGLLPSCLPWLHERSVAILATDTATDVMPGAYPFPPVHTVAMVAMGVWIVDACDLEGLSVAAAEQERSHFLVTCNPLRLKNATGSPVNPIAVF